MSVNIELAWMLQQELLREAEAHRRLFPDGEPGLMSRIRALFGENR